MQEQLSHPVRLVLVDANRLLDKFHSLSIFPGIQPCGTGTLVSSNEEAWINQLVPMPSD
jgi:hypothetical protein